MSDSLEGRFGLHQTLTEHFEFGGVMTFDRDQVYLSAGGKGFDVIDMDPDDVIGRTPAELFSDDVAEAVSEQFRRALAGEQSTARVSFQGRSYDCWAAPRRSDSDEIVGGVLISWDVTEAVGSQEELQLVRLAVDELPVGLTIAEVRGEERPLIFANEGFLGLTGYDRDEVLGRDCRFLQGPETEPDVVETVGRSLAAREDVQVTLLNYRKDGTPFWNRLSIYPVGASSGEVTHFIGIQEDVTEHRLRGIQLQRSEKMRALGQMAGGVAHDLRNVLMGAGGLIELVLDEDSLDDEAREDLTEARRLLSRGTSVASRLLAFAREEMVEQGPIELNAALRDRVRFFRRVLREDVELRLDEAEDETWIVGDEGQVDQVLLNLAKNAEQAMPDGGVLELSVVAGDAALDPFPGGREDGGSWGRISIRDTGAGMSPEVVRQAFDPFFTTRKGEGGTGLGLSSVHGAVEKMGGKVAIDSTPGEGTTVHLAFPRAEAPVEPAPVDAPRAESRRGSRILLVEDEDAVRRVCLRILEKAGYDVEAVADAAEAGARISQRPEEIDLLLTDVVLPGGSGPRLAEELQEVRPGIPVIFMSGYADEEVEREKISPNVSFLSKPFEVESLRRLVDSVLS